MKVDWMFPWFIVYTGQDSLNADGYAKAYETALAKFAAIHKLVNEIAPDQIELATSSQQVRDIIGKGKKSCHDRDREWLSCWIGH